MKIETNIIIGLIVLAVILVSLCGYFGLEIEKRKAYDRGIDAGEMRLANQIIQGRRIETDTGFILFILKQE